VIVNGDLNSNVNSEIIQGPAAVRGEIDQNINIDENIIVDFQENMLPEQIDIENSSFDIRSIPVENDIPSNIDMVNPRMVYIFLKITLIYPISRF
jgi:hypothetical protein